MYTFGEFFCIFILDSVLWSSPENHDSEVRSEKRMTNAAFSANDN